MTKAKCEPGNCGSACCNPVMLPFTQTEYALQNYGDERQNDWVANDLTRIPSREGYEAHPYLRGVRLVDQYGDETVPKFYRCRHFDADENRCGDYENRPGTCRDYPWGYESSRVMREAMTLPPSCSFNADLGREVEVRIR